ncbi:hypothetical protein U9M48_032895 [Paspalum notatum var. saurae]|uniref:Uncharacterized protein n=1 Tax=Paspalum notatum var. saurae TaxID=547442 RepID=A0AAQ3X5G5_PASNO
MALGGRRRASWPLPRPGSQPPTTRMTRPPGAWPPHTAAIGLAPRASRSVDLQESLATGLVAAPCLAWLADGARAPPRPASPGLVAVGHVPPRPASPGLAAGARTPPRPASGGLAAGVCVPPCPASPGLAVGARTLPRPAGARAPPPLVGRDEWRGGESGKERDEWISIQQGDDTREEERKTSG